MIDHLTPEQCETIAQRAARSLGGVATDWRLFQKHGRARQPLVVEFNCRLPDGREFAACIAAPYAAEG